MLDLPKSFGPANKRFVAWGLAATIGLQMLVLATEYLSSVAPLWFGTPVVLKTTPIDPRSLFRGTYVRLNYDISSIDRELAEGKFKRGEVAYVMLKREGEFHIASGLQREKPLSGDFIRGRVQYGGSGYRMKYGIEAYFMPKEKALRAEKSVRQGARAEVFLLSNGKAAIANLICESGDC